MKTSYKNLIRLALLYFKAIMKIGVPLIVVGSHNTALGQLKQLQNKVLAIKTSSDSLNKLASIEKIYMQFDKPYYALGDTIFFKVYLLNCFLTASDKSGIINIDIANDSNRVIQQYRILAKNGIGWCNLNINEKNFNPGSYTLRAWTQWMCNRGDTDFFYKQFYISSIGEHNWLVNARFKTTSANSEYLTDVGLQFSNMDKKPFAAKTLQLQVMSGDKGLYSKKLQTDGNGKLDVNFAVPQNGSKLVIVAQDERKDKRAVIPVPLDRTENIDVQFMPEGGELVAGLPSHIGFKAIGESGRGINLSGIVIDKKQNTVASFSDLHNGMGSFILDIKPGEIYAAKVKLKDGTIKTVSLPTVRSSGTVLQVRNYMQSDSIEIIADATEDIAGANSNYFLIGKSRGVVCYAAVIGFNKDQNAIRQKIAKSLFPSGITQLILMTTDKKPLNERLIYIDHRDDLNIWMTANKISYMPHDSISLRLKVTDVSGKPVAANFSMAVTDDSQVKKDTLNDDNIITRMLLTSDLKGYVETPDYYANKNDKTWRALDDLMLTQGWMSYQPVADKLKLQYPPEKEFTVRGKVTNVFGKPLKKTDVLLLSKSPTILMDTTTDVEGRFVFDHLPRIDTPVFIIRAVNKSGKSFNVNLNVDELKLPIFTSSRFPAVDPWYVNSDTSLLNFTRTDDKAKQLLYTPKGVHVLKEVEIKAIKIVKGSQNLNGPGGADFVMDEKDLEHARKKDWLQLLEENVKGFREMELRPHYPLWYYIYFKKVFFVIDGVFLEDIIPDLDFWSLKDYLRSHNAEDIKGIEVMSGWKYNAKYKSRFLSIDLLTDPDMKKDQAFVEITTRSGKGPVIKNTPGVYLYKPLALSYPKQFYKPKYTITDTAKQVPDLRSTIDWEPNIVTDANGEARVSFYAADMPSVYTVTIEGSDMNGDLGYKRQKIVINNKEAGKGK